MNTSKSLKQPTEHYVVRFLLYFLTTETMSKISDLYNSWDIKYFRWIHKQKQLAMWREYVSYTQFRRRLETGMTLRDAIYSPCAVCQRRTRKPKHPIEDNIRRRATLREENIQIIDLDELWKIEAMKHNTQYIPCDKHWNPLPLEQPKPTLRDRFISFLKRCQKRK